MGRDGGRSTPDQSIIVTTFYAVIIWGGGAGRVVFSRLFFHLMFKAGFFFHTPVEARFFFHKELKVRLFFYSHVSSQRYSHYFQG